MQEDKNLLLIMDEIQTVLDAVDIEPLQRLAEMIASANRVFVTGAGRSGLTIRAFGMRLVHLGYTVFVVGDTTAAAIKPGDVLIVCSGSGTTKSIIHQMEQAIRAGARCAAVTAHPTSPVASLAELQVLVPLPESQQFGGSLFEQVVLILLDSLVLRMAENAGTSYREMAARHANLE